MKIVIKYFLLFLFSMSCGAIFVVLNHLVYLPINSQTFLFFTYFVGVIVQIILFIIGRKNKLFDFRGYKIIFNLGFFVISYFFYFISCYITMAFLYMLNFH